MGKKQPWQATMFVPSTVTNVEVIGSALVKLLLGRERPIGFKPRESGDELQAELHTDLLDHQIDRSNFPKNFAEVAKEALIFGSGFAKFFWEKTYDKRRLKTQIKSGFKDMVTKGLRPGTPLGEKESVQEVVVKDQVTVKKIHIRDIFPEPNSLDLRRVLERAKITYGELVDLSKKKNDYGDYLADPESVAMLRGVTESDQFEIDQKVVKYDQNIQDNPLPRPSYDKNHTVWEFWGEIPRKWVQMDLPDGDLKGEEIIPGKIMVASSQYFLASEENPMQSMETPYLKLNYIDTGQTYGMGVAELMAGLQDEYNEIRNLRIDNVVFAMNKMYIAIRNRLVDPDNIVNQPGGVIFAKGSEVTDIRSVISELPVQDVALSGFRETGELERQIQEVTGANRVTTGTAGLTKDTNQTLGGMELLKQSAADRFTTVAYLMGRSFLIPAAKKYMELIYQNMGPDMIKRILGSQPIEIMPGQIIAKWQAFKKMAPHDLFMDYDIIPFDVFSEENKGAKAQMLMSMGQFIATVIPGWSPKTLIKKVAHYQGLSYDEIEDIIGNLDNIPMQTPMGMGQGVPSISKTSTSPTSSSPSPRAATPQMPTGAGLGGGM